MADHGAAFGEPLADLVDLHGEAVAVWPRSGAEEGEWHNRDTVRPTVCVLPGVDHYAVDQSISDLLL